jgi:hypothetical protein
MRSEAMSSDARLGGDGLITDRVPCVVRLDIQRADLADPVGIGTMILIELGCLRIVIPGQAAPQKCTEVVACILPAQSHEARGAVPIPRRVDAPHRSQGVPPAFTEKRALQ